MMLKPRMTRTKMAVPPDKVRRMACPGGDVFGEGGRGLKRDE